jgi:hypothetical protein
MTFISMTHVLSRRNPVRVLARVGRNAASAILGVSKVAIGVLERASRPREPQSFEEALQFARAIEASGRGLASELRAAACRVSSD